ncbi:MAG: PadR family transcriptional regulator [Candidatus Bathyarchaeia archaeon]|nr:PadR family transcriptional regulator [Candidatus Bathyarchaeota archaeon]
MAELEQEILKAVVRGFSRVMILWLLTKASMSGYGITRELKRLAGWSFRPGVVYPLLYELEESGLIQGKWMEKGRRRIKYYSTTENGVKLLNRVKDLLGAPVKEVLKEIML